MPFLMKQELLSKTQSNKGLGNEVTSSRILTSLAYKRQAGYTYLYKNVKIVYYFFVKG